LDEIGCKLVQPVRSRPNRLNVAMVIRIKYKVA
jgi:hypothetical protein